MRPLSVIAFAATMLAGTVIVVAEETCPCPDPEAGACPTPQGMDPGIIGFITKTQGNSYFGKMGEGARECAGELGVDLRTYAGEFEGDNESQVAAIESLIAAGAKGFAIVPSDSSAIVPTIQRARDAGLLVVVLDTPLDPIDAADATFATDNRDAGRLIGAWAKGTLGDAAADAKIAFLDFATSQPTVDYLRNQGFMEGFGIDVNDPNRYGDEEDPRICGHEMTAGSAEGGRTAIERLLQKCPDINLVYAFNERAAEGGYEALKAAGKDDGSVLIVSIDGGCQGVEHVRNGMLSATSQQYPSRAAAMAVRAIASGTVREMVPSNEAHYTGASLVTDRPASGVKSIGSARGAEICW